MHSRFPEVTVDYQDALPDLRQHHPQVGAGDALSFASSGAGKQNDPGRVVHESVEQVRAQGTVCLRSNVGGIQEGHKLPGEVSALTFVASFSCPTREDHLAFTIFFVTLNGGITPKV